MQAEAKHLGDFLRRIAIDYARFGYTRYALREIPQDKDVASIDKKLRDTYNVTSCRTTRMRMKQKGQARVQYLRFRHSFILLGTEGIHTEFSRIQTHDMRISPLHFRGYSIGFIGETVSVQVSHDVWSRVKWQIHAVALEGKPIVEKAISSLPFYRFPGVVRQKFSLVSDINTRRKQAGLPLIRVPLPPRYRRGEFNNIESKN